MSRLVRQDFDEFREFLERFRFEGVLSQDEFVNEMRRAHTQFIAILAAVGELSHPDGSGRAGFIADYGSGGATYLAEVLSDSSEALLGMATGCLRSSASVMRSSIESFAKSLSASECPEILTRTSVPEVFDLASTSKFFSSTESRRGFGNLKDAYAGLNLYVHTVTAAQMFNAPALGVYPRVEPRLPELITIYVRIIRLFLFLLVLVRRDLFDLFDHRNREIILAALTRDQRRTALG